MYFLETNKGPQVDNIYMSEFTNHIVIPSDALLHNISYQMKKHDQLFKMPYI